MNENRNARPAVAAAGQASGTDYEGQYSHKYFKGKLTPCQEMVLCLIPTERDRAISRVELMALTGLDERTLYEIIRQLRVDHGIPILSEKTGGGGYWLSNDPDEILRAARSKDHECNSARKVADAFRRAADKMSGQTSLDDWLEVSYEK